MWHYIDLGEPAVMLTVHVQPGAKTTGIVGVYNNALKIRLTAPPVDGKANKVLIDYLAKCFSVPARNITLESGQQSRRKRLRIQGVKDLPGNLAAWKEEYDESSR